MFLNQHGAGNFPVHHVHMVNKSANKKPPLVTRSHLRAWREFRGLTLEEVAPYLGLTHGQLSKIERGKSPYNQRVLEIASGLYVCSILDLLTRDPDEAADLFSAYAKLDEEGKRRAARLVEALKNDH